MRDWNDELNRLIRQVSGVDQWIEEERRVRDALEQSLPMGFDISRSLAAQLEEEQRIREQAIEPLVSQMNDIASASRIFEDIGLTGRELATHLVGGDIDGIQQRVSDWIDDHYYFPECALLVSQVESFLRSTEDSALARYQLDLEQRVEEICASLRFPWARMEDTYSSVAGLGQIVTLGSILEEEEPLADEPSKASAEIIGHWPTRGHDLPSSRRARVQVYHESGFDRRISELTPITVYGVSISVGLIHPESVEQFPKFEDPSPGQLRAWREYALRMWSDFEEDIRTFIAMVMRKEFGKDWEKEVDTAIIKRWYKTRENAIADGRPKEPIIYYASSSDYAKLVQSHWGLFKGHFPSKRSVVSALDRSGRVIRNAGYHMRYLGLEDLLCLMSDITAIGKSIRKSL